MIRTNSERRLAENEVMFRKLNESIQEGINRTNELALEDNQPEHIIKQLNDNQPLFFYCECSDEKCIQRIEIGHQLYNEIHKHRNRFIVSNGHQVVAIERVVSKEPNYMIVEKHLFPPKDVKTFNVSGLDNA